MSFIKNIFLPNFLRSYSTDISRIHSFIDLIFALYLFTSGNGINEFSLFYYLSIYSVIVFSLRSLQKSLRSYSLAQIICKISFVYFISCFLTFLINSLFIPDLEINIFRYIFISSFWFYIYLFFSHLITRILLKIYRKSGGNTRSILIWGNYDSATNLLNYVINSKWLGFNIKGWFSPSPGDQKLRNDFYKGGFNEMKNWLKNNKIDCAIIASDSNLSEIITFFGNTNLNVYYLPSWSDSTMKLSISNIGSNRLLSIWESNELPFALLIKRIADFFIAIMLLILLSPIMFIIFLLIKFQTKDNSIFKQERYGFNGKVFLFINLEQ